MDRTLLQELSSRLKITPERVFREYWEMTLLKEISEEEWSISLGFKGGTALRLAYGSPRFSDDLDFSLLRPLKTAKVFRWAERVSRKFSLDVTDLAEKRNTLLVEFRVRGGALPQPIKQKIEISKRPIARSRDKYKLLLLSSEVSNAQVLLSVATLELIWEGKFAALKERKEPRDLFDLWFISQKLKRQMPDSIPRLSKRLLRLQLNKYLPLNLRRVVAELENL